MAMSVLNSYRTCDSLDGSMQTEEADRPLPFISLMEFVSKIYQVENDYQIEQLFLCLFFFPPTKRCLKMSLLSILNLSSVHMFFGSLFCFFIAQVSIQNPSRSYLVFHTIYLFFLCLLIFTTFYRRSLSYSLGMMSCGHL